MKLRERCTRWSVLAAMLLGAVTLGHAYDEDHAQAHLQPFFGVYLGAYQNSTDDVNNLLPNKKNDFLPVMPNGGVTLGVAYDRFHAGFGVGYQMPNYNDLSETDRNNNAMELKDIAYGRSTACEDTVKACYFFPGTSKTYRAFKDFSYDVIPLDAFVEVNLFKNSSAINFLMGGSAGAAFVSLTQPRPLYSIKVQDTIKTYFGTGGENGSDKQTLFLYTAYVGARINIAERLNLQGQVGWRGMFNDKIYYADCDCYAYETTEEDVVVDPATGTIKGLGYVPVRNYRLDLSGAFVRADLRWTFASQSEKDADRATMRRQALDEARIASAYRLR
jgi:hypothetical protein